MIIDSHVLLWWLEDRPELSGRAKAILDRAESDAAGFHVCAVSLWELRLKELRGILQPSQPVREWPRYLARLNWLVLEPTTPEIWLRSAELDWPHRDPADRIIAATAAWHALPVLTKDRAFHKKGCPVKAVW